MSLRLFQHEMKARRLIKEVVLVLKVLNGSLWL